MPEHHIPSKADIDRLRVAIEGVPDDQGNMRGGLNERVDRLAGRFDDVEAVNARTRHLTIAMGLVIAFLGLGGWYFIDRLHDQAVTQCEGANERFGVQRNLWSGILTESADNPEEMRAVKAIIAYTDAGFADRNCEDLSEPFEAPDFPDLALRQDD